MFVEHEYELPKYYIHRHNVFNIDFFILGNQLYILLNIITVYTKKYLVNVMRCYDKICQKQYAAPVLCRPFSFARTLAICIEISFANFPENICLFFELYRCCKALINNIYLAIQISLMANLKILQSIVNFMHDFTSTKTCMAFLALYALKY